ncbi:MAG TPA: DUF2238 domain-containing protein [Bacteroidia bacterium]|jgi:putative membrane protein|nr:DUF2238 domain-containing protein [Bacteroidia bacterium]
MEFKDKKLPFIFLVIFFLVLIWSAINPKEYFTWGLEIFPAFIALFVLIFTFKKFKLTNLTYTLILIHSSILMVGGHYTYAEVPLFDWLKEALHQSRNNYDKVGHFAQGFVPAIIIREVFIRKNIINSKAWRNFLTVCTCMAISVCYEFTEWVVAEASGQSAEAFLGTQGYVWDTQSDMLYAIIGAICALLLLSKAHNKQLKVFV